MDQKSDKEQEKPLNISNVDIQSTSLANQQSNYNINIDMEANDLSVEKNSNLDFTICTPCNDEVILKKCSPDYNISSSNSCSGNEEDDNVEYKLIEKNVLNDDKFNLFLKKTLIEENLTENEKDSFDTDVNNPDENIKNLKSILLNEEALIKDVKNYTLIIDDDFGDERLYKKLNTCSNNYDEDFIEEDIVPLNIKTQQAKNRIVNESPISKNLSETYTSNAQLNENTLLNEENNSQTLCYNLSLSDDDNNQNKNYENAEMNKVLNELESAKSELKFESLSSIEDNDLNKSFTTLSDSLRETQHTALEKDSTFKHENRAAFIWSGK